MARPSCHGSGRPGSLALTFAGRTVAEVNAMTFADLVALLQPVAELTGAGAATSDARSGEATEVAVGSTEPALEGGCGAAAPSGDRRGGPGVRTVAP